MAETKQLTPLKEVFERVDIKKRFFDMLGEKAPGFIVSVLNTVSNNKDLKEADGNSIIYAAATAATLDLPINQNLGFAYIIAYKGKDGTKAQFQMGYKGFIQLAQRSGQFKTINATDVREGEIKRRDRMTGEIEIEWIENDEERKKLPVVGYIGYFKLVTGFEKSMYMSVGDLQEHGLKYSQSYKSKKDWVRDSSLWATDFDAMAIKTVIKLLLSKYAPLSIEMQKAVTTDQSIVNDWDGQNLEYVDNPQEETPSVESVAEEKAKQSALDHIKKSKTLKKLQEAEDYVKDLSEDNEVRIAYTNKQIKLQPKEDEGEEELVF